jgi:hypothetical protein
MPLYLYSFLSSLLHKLLWWKVQNDTTNTEIIFQGTCNCIYSANVKFLQFCNNNKWATEAGNVKLGNRDFPYAVTITNLIKWQKFAVMPDKVGRLRNYENKGNAEMFITL